MPSLLPIDWEPFLSSIVLPLLIRSAIALFILLIAISLSRRLRKATINSLGRTGADPSINVFIGTLTRLGILAVGVVLALGIMGISWTALLAVVGIVGIGIGLAIQDVMKSFVAGFYLLIERPFRVGDLVRIRDHVGQVVDIYMRTTVLRRDDGQLIVVPNSVVFSEILVNLSAVKEPENGETAEEEAPGGVSELA